MKYPIVFFGILFGAACASDSSIKIDAATRRHIDTTAARQIQQLSLILDKYCGDSSPVLVRRATDSMLRVRQQELLNKQQ